MENDPETEYDGSINYKINDLAVFELVVQDIMVDLENYSEYFDSTVSLPQIKEKL